MSLKCPLGGAENPPQKKVKFHFELVLTLVLCAERFWIAEMDLLPTCVIKQTVSYLPIQECARLYRCSKRLSSIVRLPYAAKDVCLAFISCKGWDEPPEISRSMIDNGNQKVYIWGGSPTFDTIRYGLRSTLMKPFLGSLRLIVNSCKFDELELNSHLLDAFRDAPVIGDMYMAYCHFTSFEIFHCVLDTVKARRYTIRTLGDSQMIEYVNIYSEIHPETDFHLVIPSWSKSK